MTSPKRCECDKPFVVIEDDDSENRFECCFYCTGAIPTTLAGLERRDGPGTRRPVDTPGDSDARHGKRELRDIGPFRAWLNGRIAECGYNAMKDRLSLGTGQYVSLLKRQTRIDLATVDKYLCRDRSRTTLADLYGADA